MPPTHHRVWLDMNEPHRNMLCLTYKDKILKSRICFLKYLVEFTWHLDTEFDEGRLIIVTGCANNNSNKDEKIKQTTPSTHTHTHTHTHNNNSKNNNNKPVKYPRLLDSPLLVGFREVCLFLFMLVNVLLSRRVCKAAEFQQISK